MDNPTITPITWNYRVIQHDGGAEVAEVYYDDDNAIIGWCPVTLGADTVDELRESINDIILAWEMPAINCEDLPEGPHTHGEAN